MGRKQHTIDFLFPIALFFVFSSTALVALLLASHIYQGIVSVSEEQFTQRTSLSYVTTKIQRSDNGGTENIYLSIFDGCDALAIESQYGDTSFVTYIYETEGELREIFLQKGVEASAQSGTSIIEVQDFSMKELSEGLFQFTCTSSEGCSDSVIVSVRSQTL